MSVVGEFTIPAESFILDHALATVPEMTIEADRLASHSPREVFPFFWATGGDFETFQRALEDDPDTTAVSVAEETNDDVLYRLEWRQEVLDLVQEMVDHHAAISEATARDGRWHLRLRFAEEGMVTQFQNHFRDNDHNFEVLNLVHPGQPRQREYGLTAEQFDALVAAVEAGYFEVPRATSIEELGESLDISGNAVSQRLRRGTDVVLRRALTIRDDTVDGS